jgi:23S rRNA pseudouridine2457 synthase
LDFTYSMSSLILFNKPFGVISQFSAGSTGDQNRPTLARYIKLPNVYPAGRLDHDSEGLLLLTDDGQVQHHIAHPAHKLPKTYWVQVEGAPNSYALTKLRQGVELNDGITLPAEARLIPTPKLWERDPPIRSRVNIPTQWIEIVITEGKNRQIRRMTAAVGHPTLRLVRVKIGNWTLEGIAPGEYKATTINLPKSALAEMPRGRANNRPNQRQEPRAAAAGDNAKSNDGQKQPPRDKTNSSGDKNRRKPGARESNTSKPAALKPSVATKVIIKPSRSKPTE